MKTMLKFVREKKQNKKQEEIQHIRKVIKRMKKNSRLTHKQEQAEAVEGKREGGGMFLRMIIELWVSNSCDINK